MIIQYVSNDNTKATKESFQCKLKFKSSTEKTLNCLRKKKLWCKTVINGNFVNLKSDTLY